MDEPWFKMASLSFVAGLLMILFGLDFTQIPQAAAVATKTYYNYDIEVDRLINSQKDLKTYASYLGKTVNAEKEKGSFDSFMTFFEGAGNSLTPEEKQVINNFIVYGAVSQNKILPDQRFLLVQTFLKKNKYLPKTSEDWYLLLAGRKKVKVKEYLE